MNSSIPEIGFSSQRLRYEWVSHTALLSLAGMTGEIMTAELDCYLSEILSSAGEGKRGSREKAITILKRIWSTDTKDLKDFRSDGLDLLRALPENKHLAVHWGMTMASYPYWYHTATSVGRLLRLQGTANSTQIRRRMQESYGDREIVARATRNVVRSFISWGTLAEAGSKGTYFLGATLPIEDPRLIAWLIEAILYAHTNDSVPLKDLLDSPSLFPFRIKSIPAESVKIASPRIEINLYGIEDNFVMLKKVPAGL